MSTVLIYQWWDYLIQKVFLIGSRPSIRKRFWKIWAVWRSRGWIVWFMANAGDPAGSTGVNANMNKAKQPESSPKSHTNPSTSSKITYQVNHIILFTHCMISAAIFRSSQSLFAVSCVWLWNIVLYSRIVGDSKKDIETVSNKTRTNKQSAK